MQSDVHTVAEYDSLQRIWKFRFSFAYYLLFNESKQGTSQRKRTDIVLTEKLAVFKNVLTYLPQNVECVRHRIQLRQSLRVSEPSVDFYRQQLCPKLLRLQTNCHALAHPLQAIVWRLQTTHRAAPCRCQVRVTYSVMSACLADDRFMVTVWGGEYGLCQGNYINRAECIELPWSHDVSICSSCTISASVIRVPVVLKSNDFQQP